METESNLPGAGNELSIYSNERYYKGPGVKTRRYTYRIDGFVSLHASFQGGEVITRPIIFQGSKLLMNFSTSAAGSVRAEIRESGGDPIRGYTLSECPEIYGDEIARVITWNSRSGLSELAGKAIRLRFVMRDADLFAFGFQDGP